MKEDISNFILNKITWEKLPSHIQQKFGNDQKEYQKYVFAYSVDNQLFFRENLISKYMRNKEAMYYEQLLTNSRRKLLIYPYHLQTQLICGLRVTPFAYYVDMLADMMAQDRSYDFLPNFTAADLLRLLGIGRNQYIDLINSVRSTNHNPVFSNAFSSSSPGSSSATLKDDAPLLAENTGFNFPVSHSHGNLKNNNNNNNGEDSLLSTASSLGESAVSRTVSSGIGGRFKRWITGYTTNVAATPLSSSLTSSPFAGSVEHQTGATEKATANDDFYLASRVALSNRVKRMLPSQPLPPPSHLICDWWRVSVGSVLESDVEALKAHTPDDKRLLDWLIDQNSSVSIEHICKSFPSDDSAFTSTLEETEIDENENGKDKQKDEDKIKDKDEKNSIRKSLVLRSMENLYRLGLIYFDVPISPEDHVIVPTLAGGSFVMNRTAGDYLEVLLYKVFVSIDGQNSVAELASLLEISLPLLQRAVSVFCRLGFARRKSASSFSTPPQIEPQDVRGWSNSILRELDDSTDAQTMSSSPNVVTEDRPPPQQSTPKLEARSNFNSQSISHIQPAKNKSKRIAFVYDSALNAYLMMGNLSPGLKNHAVTMYEVGKLTNEAAGLANFRRELAGIRIEQHGASSEGEVLRFFGHAIALRDTIDVLCNAAPSNVITSISSSSDSSQTQQQPINTTIPNDLQQQKQLEETVETRSEKANANLNSLDLLRCGSLCQLDAATRHRLLTRNYAALVSMAPISLEDPGLDARDHTAHMGPPCLEANSASVWFRLFVCVKGRCGPPSLLLCAGARLRKLPPAFLIENATTIENSTCRRLVITSWQHDNFELDPGKAGIVLALINELLQYGPVFLQCCVIAAAKTKKTIIKNSINKQLEGEWEEQEEEEEKLKTLDPRKVTLEESLRYEVFPIREETTQHDVTLPDFVWELSRAIPMTRCCPGYISYFVSGSRKRHDFDKENVMEKERDEEEMCLFEMHFGVPLFDLELNKRVLEATASASIIKMNDQSNDTTDTEQKEEKGGKRGLFSEENLFVALPEASQSLVCELRAFITKWEGFWLEGVMETATSAVGGGGGEGESMKKRFVARPTKSLFFFEGRLEFLSK